MSFLRARFALVSWLLLTSFLFAQDPKPSPASDPARDKEIAEIKKQLEELNAKLKKLSDPAAPSIPEGILAETYTKSLQWRPLGPAAMGGRITALSVSEADPSLWYVATASGGLLKTINNGVTFDHLFDKEVTVSIGDVCVAPSNKDIVYIGTGEGNPRNSVSYGDGIYKSVDGGKTWTNVGLKDSFQIGKILIHPKDPNIVYVGALGRLYGPNAERGLFKTIDGGKSWNKILFVDEKTGVIEMKMKPDDPETLIVAMYERQRDLYDFNDPVKKIGPGSGLHKTTDGGKTWKKLTKGLPTNQLGRVGLDFWKKDPNVVFAVIESANIGKGPTPAAKPGDPAKPTETKASAEKKEAARESRQASESGEGEAAQPRPPQQASPGPVFLGVTGDSVTGDGGAKLDGVADDSPASKAGLKVGDVITAIGDKPIKTYAELVSFVPTKKPGEKAKAKVQREGKELEIEITFLSRPGDLTRDGVMGLGLDPKKPFGGLLGGQIENVQNRQGPEGFEYGGIYKSVDGGESWTRINSLNPRPMYFSQIRVDPSDDQFLFVLGIAVHRSTDGGKTFRTDVGRDAHSDHHALWIDPRDGRHLVLCGDGGIYQSYDRGAKFDHYNHVAIGQFYHVAIDTRKNYRVYGGLQDNGSWGGPSVLRNGGSVNEDWLNIGGGDGFKCQVDPNDADQVYYTSQNGAMGRRNLKTLEAAGIRPITTPGKTYRFNWNTPFLLSSHNSRIFLTAGNVVFKSLDRGNDLRAISPEIPKTKEGSATALSESPKNPDVIYVGTDDGAFWMTKDGGKNWVDIQANVGLPKPCYVATIEASRYEEGRVYACFDGHRSDLDDPLIFVSEDFGKTWKAIKGELPRGSTRCLREDIANANLLWLGTEFHAYASIDRGEHWSKINNNLPTVAIHEFAQHPTTGEIVVATHGRSLWVTDISSIRQTTKDVLKNKVTLFKPSPVIRWRNEPSRGGTNRKFEGQNPPRGASVYYYLGEKAEKASLKVFDFDGTMVRELTVSKEPGMHRSSWDLLGLLPPAVPGAPAPAPRSTLGGLMGGFRRGGGGGPRMGQVATGSYKVVLSIDGKDFNQGLRLDADPNYPETGANGEFSLEEEDEEGSEEEMFERSLERGESPGKPIDD